MKKVSLSGASRAHVGKKDAATLRRSGRIPAVIYGGENQVHFHVDRIEMEKVVYSPDVYEIELDVAGTVYSAIIKDMQFHPVTDNILHIDFLQVTDSKPVVVGLPVRVTGNSIGILNGGALSMNFRKIRVRGLVSDIPECVELDITPLKIGDKIRVGEISIDGCELVQADSSVIVAVRKTRAAMSADTLAEDEEGGEEGATEEGGEAPAAEGGEE